MAAKETFLTSCVTQDQTDVSLWSLKTNLWDDGSMYSSRKRILGDLRIVTTSE